MFVLTITGRTSQPDAVRRHVAAWPDVVGSAATGWLGSTGGVSADGELVLLLRFQSQEAAYLTSDLPSSAQWWEQCRRLLTEPPVFAESTAVTGILGGGSDRAGAVRITRGTASRARLRDTLRQLEALPAEERGPVMGGLVAWHEDDTFTEALYLASDQSREAPSASPALHRVLGAHDAAVGAGKVIDLAEPWLASPGRSHPGEAG